MSNKTAAYLLEKYKTGNCSPEEKKIVENYIIFEGITENKFSDAELDSHISDLSARLTKITINIKLWRYIAAAAAVLLLVSATILFYNLQENGSTVSALTAKTDIPPGKNMATLLLENGKVIHLSDAKSGIVINASELSYSDGSAISSQADNISINTQVLTARTPKGGTYQITLPDGTTVWLNAASSLKFPGRFSGGQRRIILEGEAYFEVFKDRKHPFIVEAGNHYIRVLGTHFNISAYKDEPEIKTTLIEGSVETSGIVLQPGEQAVQKQNEIQVIQVNPKMAMAWKNGEFMFNNERLESIMKKISRWYNIEIEYKAPALKNELFSGTISRYGKVSEVLQMLELTGTVHFRIEGRRITIMK